VLEINIPVAHCPIRIIEEPAVGIANSVSKMWFFATDMFIDIIKCHGPSGYRKAGSDASTVTASTYSHFMP
jgi:hypothetical protein